MTFQKLSLNGENIGEANLEIITEDAPQNVPKALQVHLFTPLPLGGCHNGDQL